MEGGGGGLVDFVFLAVKITKTIRKHCKIAKIYVSKIFTMIKF